MVRQSLAPHIAAGEGLSYGYHFWTGSLERGEGCAASRRRRA
jgi:hypothetical protein